MLEKKRSLGFALVVGVLATIAFPTPSHAVGQGTYECQFNATVTSPPVALIPSETTVQWNLNASGVCFDTFLGGPYSATLNGQFQTQVSGCALSATTALPHSGLFSFDIPAVFNRPVVMSAFGALSEGVMTLTTHDFLNTGHGEFLQDASSTAACATNGSAPTTTSWTGVYVFQE